ncbi:MAG: DNA-directed RNA polymerase subunit alpha [Acidimicrobiaceae bacterium]|nr:DNA-directed RNA polymerase subunit alpha [Acidimicrobiaceae bacterium]MCS5675479.1 DNA-directed RNA polymerase subunit alpha [Acidimicrobiales bacterium]MEE2807087.1 DNA-directed RNA polymerase subunit alpha [Actinomycetota bacterium]
MLTMQRPTVEALDDEQNNHQRFAVGPLEPGFGHTIGNSLRRTLLSSVPGAAITQVKFDGEAALHEFATIDGVVEDVTDLILNLKDIVLTCQSDEPVAVRLDASGPCDLTAGDVDWGADVECVNPELQIATLSKGGRLGVDITVEQGRGYLSSENQDSSSTIGVIPIDAIFSPVRRVSLEVEPTRVEQSTNFDRLILDIDTDGAISPRDALASAGDTLRTLVGLVADMSEEPLGLEINEVAIVETSSPELDMPIEDLDLSERPRNCLKRGQVNSIGELLEKSMDDLMAITNFGSKSLDEVIQKLDERGLALKGMTPSVQ